ncbi:MAG: preprotein translocase subunit SecG [Bacteroidetes bacterium]|jgi:preprotein translocase subunit SecG|nr:preprotein translocase subunit SecG [Bacteroidota bacterium]MBK6818227.1 preprotein translocase subunit SecG [Bacteroidota bacterium]
MTILFFILIIITCGVLAFFVLIQNPKGGGLAGSFGGLGNQMMGAKQSTDVVEKGTWVAASVLLALTLLSFMLAPKTKTDINQKTRSETVGAPAPAPAPAPAAPASNAQIPAAAPQEGQAPAQPQQGASQPAQTPPATTVPQPSNTAPTTK